MRDREVLLFFFAFFLGYLPHLYTDPNNQTRQEIAAIDGGETIELGDGRILEYFITPPNGLHNQETNTILFIHGFVMTGRFIPKLLERYQDELTQKNIRIISPSIPGWGLSTSNPSHTLGAFAEDVEQLVDHLGIKTFSIVGFSYGGPHAAAVANLLRDRGTIVPSHIDRFSEGTCSHRIYL